MAATATLAGYNTLAGSNDLALAVWLDEVAVFKTGRMNTMSVKLSSLNIHRFERNDSINNHYCITYVIDMTEKCCRGKG